MAKRNDYRLGNFRIVNDTIVAFDVSLNDRSAAYVYIGKATMQASVAQSDDPDPATIASRAFAAQRAKRLVSYLMRYDPRFIAALVRDREATIGLPAKLHRDVLETTR